MWDPFDFDTETTSDNAVAKLRVQTKRRTVAEPGDPLEREAEQVADSVAQKPSGCTCAMGERCKKCEDKLFRRASLPVPFRDVPASASDRIEQMRGSGTQLPAPWIEHMDTRLGVELGHARIHTGPVARGLSRTLDALAFTVGSDVFLGSDSIPPPGDRTLVHELTHVAQQTGDEYVLRNGDDEEPPVEEPAPEETLPEPRYKAPAAPSVPADAEQTEWGPYTLVDDEAYLRSLLEDLIAREGTVAGVEFYARLHGLARSISYGLIPPEVVDEMVAEKPSIAPAVGRMRLVKRVVNTFDKVYEAVEKEQAAFIADFESKLHIVANAMLDDSERRVRSELVRYGISSETETFGGSDCGDGQEGCGAGSYAQPVTTYSMPEEGTAAVNLAGAAKILLTRRKVVDDKKEGREDRCVYDQWGEATVIDCSEVDGEIAQVTEEYMKLYGFFVQKFPILGHLADLDAGKAGLEQVAQGPGSGTAQTISEEAYARLADIDTTRNGLKPGGDGDIWALDRIIGATAAVEGIGEGSLQSRWMQEKVKSERSQGFWKTIALAVLSIGLTLLAPVTGGLSLIGAAALGTYQAYESYKKYEFEMAAANSDFDQARAIVAEEPSMVWLALDILGAIADVAEVAGAAFKAVKASRMLKAERIYKSVVPHVRAVEAGEALTEEVRAAIRTSVTKAGGDLSTAERIIARLEKGINESEELRKALSLSADEAAGLFDAKGAWSTKLPEDELISEGSSAVGKVHITKNGWLWSCGSPCSVLREKYKDILGLDEYAKEAQMLAELEQRAAKAAVDGRPQELFEVARDASYLDGVLRTGRTALNTGALDELVELAKLNPALSYLDGDALARIAAHGPEKWYIKGQLHEELLNERLWESGYDLAHYAPTELGEDIASGAIKLEYIPGHAIRDVDGKMLTDGVIGYWKNDKFVITTLFEAKAGRASSRGLRRKFTGFTRSEMDDIIDFADREGMQALLKADSDAFDLVGEAARDFAYKNWKKATGQTLPQFRKQHAQRIKEGTEALMAEGKLSRSAAEKQVIHDIMDEQIKQTVRTEDLIQMFGPQVRREMGRHVQSEAGQLTKSGERLGADEELFFYGQKVPYEMHAGGRPEAVGVLPMDVPESSLGDVMAEGGIKSYQTLNLDLTDAELDLLADQIVTMLSKTTP